MLRQVDDAALAGAGNRAPIVLQRCVIVLSRHGWFFAPQWLVVETMTVLRAAMRVLTAISERKEARLSDLGMLRKIVPDLDIRAPLDELACTAIRQALKDQDTRRAGKTGDAD